MLQGFTGALPVWTAPHEQLPADLSGDGRRALRVSSGLRPCIVVFVDAWTSLGGSQFVDSPGTGRYHTYLCEDVVPFVDAIYRTLDDPAHRGVQGKSSGGFGAMITAMMRPGPVRRLRHTCRRRLLRVLLPAGLAAGLPDAA